MTKKKSSGKAISPPKFRDHVHTKSGNYTAENDSDQTNNTTQVVRLKLVIDTKGKRVLFAEAEADFVGFLRNFLSLRVGTVIKLLNNRSVLGSLGSNLSDGIENQSLTDLFEFDWENQPATCYYMVMDDLTVKPMSTQSSVALFNEFNGKEVGPLEERVVHLKLAEGLKLVKASLQTIMVLTSVFLGDKGDSDRIFQIGSGSLTGLIGCIDDCLIASGFSKWPT